MQLSTAGSGAGIIEDFVQHQRTPTLSVKGQKLHLCFVLFEVSNQVQAVCAIKTVVSWLQVFSSVTQIVTRASYLLLLKLPCKTVIYR